MAAAVCSKVLGVFFEYDTPKIVHIRSKKVGVINRFLQFCIIGYIIGYAIIFKKGYQEFDPVRGAVTTKLKGVARTANFTPGEDFRIWDVSDYVVPPQENNAFFVTTNYIVTDGQQIGTCEEDLKIPGVNCTLDASVCVKGKALMLGDGFMTGECIDSTRYPGDKACEVEAWCPTEDGSKKAPKPAALDIAKNFTVFIKNYIEFPKFGVKRRNIPKSINNQTYLQSCRFDFGSNKLCPVFELGTIVTDTGSPDFSDIALQTTTVTSRQNRLFGSKGSPVIKKEFSLKRNIIGFENNTQLQSCLYKKDHAIDQYCPIFQLQDIAMYANVDFSALSEKGGVIQIIINWDCNLDYNVEDCVPEYKFRRLDSADEIVSPGYNFRHAHFYRDANGTEKRTLFKAYGIKFIVSLQGTGGKFSPMPLALTIGSGLAILSIQPPPYKSHFLSFPLVAVVSRLHSSNMIRHCTVNCEELIITTNLLDKDMFQATIICDIIVLYVLKSKALYREKKYLEVVGEDAYKEMNKDDGLNE